VSTPIETLDAGAPAVLDKPFDDRYLLDAVAQARSQERGRRSC
jgi:FixJ family two-component response regulator